MPKRSARVIRAQRAATDPPVTARARAKGKTAAVAGRDDLDLDGNWTPLADVEVEPTPIVGEARAKDSKKRPAAAEEVVQAAKKKRKKKPKPGVVLAEGSGLEEEQAVARFTAAWTAEARAASLAALEAREVTPTPAWFATTSIKPTFADLLDVTAQQRSAELVAKSVSILVLCPSAERAFVAMEDILKVWHLKTKPVVLAAHGGGRKSDQVARQGKALEKGAPVAIATPGRFQRLMEEGLLDAAGLKLLILDLTVDRKKRDILSLPETRRETFALLRKHLLPLLGKNSTGPKLVLCGVGDRGQ